VPPDEASRPHKEFDQLLKQVGLDPRGGQESKTRTALEYLAKACSKAR